MRVVVDALLGVRDADEFEQLHGAVAWRPRLRQFWCARTASVSCQPTVYTGFSDVIGSWKIMAIFWPRYRASSVFVVRAFRPAERTEPPI